MPKTQDFLIYAGENKTVNEFLIYKETPYSYCILKEQKDGTFKKSFFKKGTGRPFLIATSYIY